MRLNSKPVDTGKDNYLLSDKKKIAVAGDTEGITLGRYAITGQGECREIENSQQIPPGWEELDVTCDTVEQAERVERRITGEVEEEIQRTKEEIEQREIQLTEEQRERLNQHEEEIEEAKTKLDEYKVYEARTILEENRESFRNLQRDLMERSETASSRGGAVPGRDVEEMVQSIQEELPEELKENFEYPEDIQEKRDEIETLREQGDISEAAEMSRELVEDLEKSEEFQKLKTKQEVYQSIEDYKNRDRFDQLDNETKEELYNAEEQLYNGSIQEAEGTLNSFERSAEIQLVRNMILEALEDEEVRNAVQDIISEVVPGI
jgi:chromosome segregation ATPase